MSPQRYKDASKYKGWIGESRTPPFQYLDIPRSRKQGVPQGRIGIAVCPMHQCTFNTLRFIHFHLMCPQNPFEILRNHESCWARLNKTERKLRFAWISRRMEFREACIRELSLFCIIRHESPTFIVPQSESLFIWKKGSFTSSPFTPTPPCLWFLRTEARHPPSWQSSTLLWTCITQKDTRTQTQCAKQIGLKQLTNLSPFSSPRFGPIRGGPHWGSESSILCEDFMSRGTGTKIQLNVINS